MMTAANRIKARNSEFSAHWAKEDTIYEHQTLDQKLSAEGSSVNSEKTFHGKTLKEIAEEMKTTHVSHEDRSTENDNHEHKMDLPGDSNHSHD